MKPWKELPYEFTDDEVCEFIRAKIDQQRAAKRRFTLNFEVAVNEHGEVTNVTYQPAKERIQQK